MKNKFTILTSLFLICINTYGQQPSHFKLGEEELAGINIYNLIQDYNNDYFIATNNGLYKYDGYVIKRLECAKMTSNSVFNFKEDYNKKLYCHNLSGQIFQIYKDSCKLYFTIPDSLMSNEISYDFDDHNRLTISALKLFQVSSNKNISIIYTDTLANSSMLFRKKDSSLILFNSELQEFITIKKNKVSINKVNFGSPILSYIYYNNNLISYNRNTYDVINELTERNQKLPVFPYKNSLSRYYSDNNNFWVANLTGGVFLFDKNLTPTTKQPLFESNIISTFLKDREGNVLLGTFGEGIIVIPNIDIADVLLESNKTKVTKITSTPNGNIYFGTQNGEIFEIDSLNQITTFKEKGIQQIEILEYLPSLNSLLINQNLAVMIDIKSKTVSRLISGSVKDIYQKNEHSYLLASNAGVYSFNSDSITMLKQFIGRSYSVGFNKNTNKIYCGSALGLKIGNEKQANYFKYKSQTIMCNDIINVDDLMLVATKKNGILIFKDDLLTDVWNLKSGLSSNTIKQIKVYEQNIYISTNNGINILTKKGKIDNVLNKSSGLNSNNIIDFEISNNSLWIVTNKGIQKLELNTLKPAAYIPSISISSITVNEIIVDTSNHYFTHNRQRFIFTLSSKSLKYKNDIKYLYQLKGVDENWIENSYENNKIEYKSLPPNKYTFVVKSIYKNYESETLYYHFTIDRPYWLQSWFYLIIAIIFLSVILISFQVQVVKQKKKTQLENELNATQLTALKSQMNPHFIFNSLNSIQDLILRQEKENAYNYISKFALLVRKILHHSDKELLEFEEEIKILTVYLELEELRFKKDFSFSIINNNIIDIEIPPMLIQPFVENALKHGLLHKKGEKKLSISFELTNEILTCIIIDNGVGRVRSNEIKKRQNKSHQSFSVKSINTRLEILKNIYGEDIGVDFEDLFENNQPAGTKVILKIPFERKF